MFKIFLFPERLKNRLQYNRKKFLNIITIVNVFSDWTKTNYVYKWLVRSNESGLVSSFYAIP